MLSIGFLLMTIAMDIPTSDVAAFVEALAENSGIVISKNFYSEISVVLDALSEKGVGLDRTKDLIIMLVRKGVVSSEEGWVIYSTYLKEFYANLIISSGGCADEGYRCLPLTEADQEYSRLMTLLRTGKG